MRGAVEKKRRGRKGEDGGGMEEGGRRDGGEREERGREEEGWNRVGGQWWAWLCHGYMVGTWETMSFIRRSLSVNSH